MATLRSDVIIPEIFSPYVLEQTTKRNDFLASGVVQPLEALNLSEDGGDFVSVPFWKANLSGDLEVLSDSSSLTPGKITADKQIGVVLHRGRAWEARDLAALAAGSDPMAAIGQKVGAYLANQQQVDLLKCLEGVFGALTGGDSPAFSDLRFDTGSQTALSPRHVAKARALLGDRGQELTTVAMHSACFYDLLERKAIDYVLSSEIAGGISVDSAQPDAFAGSVAASFGDVRIATWMGMRVVISDDITNSGGVYACYFFTPGAVASGEQAALRTETDRDILAKSDAMSVDMHYIYHPVGAKWGVTTTNPTRAQLATVGNWSKVYETKNVGIVRASVSSNYD